jgi:hypothetical protein
MICVLVEIEEFRGKKALVVNNPSLAGSVRLVALYLLGLRL